MKQIINGLTTLAGLAGPLSVEQGIATLEDGTTIDLQQLLAQAQALNAMPAALLAAVQTLDTLRAGSDHTGRWLDESGAECAPDVENARWAPFTDEEQSSWIASVAEQTKNTLERIDQLLGSHAEEIPAELAEAIAKARADQAEPA